MNRDNTIVYMLLRDNHLIELENGIIKNEELILKEYNKIVEKGHLMLGGKKIITYDLPELDLSDEMLGLHMSTIGSHVTHIKKIIDHITKNLDKGKRRRRQKTKRRKTRRRKTRRKRR